MNDLIKLLPQVLMKAGAGDDAIQQAAFAAWAAAAGRHVSTVTTPLRLQDRNLIVGVIDETWRSQLKGISGQLLFKVNSLLGSPRISRLELIVNEAAVRAAHHQPPLVQFIAPEEQAALLAAKAEGISTVSLRTAFLRAAGKCLDRRAR